MDPSDLGLGTIVTAEVIKHHPWGFQVRLLPPAPDLVGSVERGGSWGDLGPGRWADLPPLGERLELMAWGHSFGLRFSGRPADIAKARGPWGTWAEARISLLGPQAGGVREPIPSSSSRLQLQYPDPSNEHGYASLIGRVYTEDGGALVPDSVDVRVRLRFWSDWVRDLVMPGVPFELLHIGYGRPVGSGILTSFAEPEP